MTDNKTTVLTSAAQQVAITRDGPTIIIGERINPTGRKALQRELKEDNFERVRRDAVAQVEAGAPVLDVNAGVPDTDEAALLSRVVEHVMAVTDVPLCIDSINPVALRAALALYEGKPLVNSINGEEKSLEDLLPIVKEHETAMIALCMDDDGIPPTAEGRLRVASKIIERATSSGIPLEDIIVDPLSMTIGADHNAGLVTLEAVRLIVEEFGVNITMGGSNISFGMPDRENINAVFMAMCIYAGMTCPIANPLHEPVAKAVLGANLVLGRDEYGMNWIQTYRAQQAAAKA
jgi:5-methyltetrahydrofolate--homocysteine methyltransferase